MNLEEIEARLAAATPGPWDADGTEVSQHWSRPEPWLTIATNEVDCMAYCYGGRGRGVERVEDAEFIAHAPEDIRALLAEVKRLQAQIDAVKALHCQDAVQPRYCAECSDFGTDQFPAGELIEWPCPTLLAFHGDKAFDRWLDQHDREVAAKALREAADAMDADPGFRDPLRLHSDWLRTLSGKSEAKQ